MSKAWDVIVVGAGPGGAVAAKKCAAAGLRTLLLEKKKMPRDKCCSGMLMGPWGQDIVRREFGDYPQEVLRDTTHLLGYAVHVPGIPVQTLDVDTPATWRRTLDTWMCNQAGDAGAEVWDSASVTAVSERDGECLVELKRGGQRAALPSTFAIGADGGNSTVRRTLLPDFKPTYLFGFRECYEVKLDLSPRRFNLFATMGPDPLFFTHDKGSYMLLEGVAFAGRLEEMLARARQFLIQNCGLSPDVEPLWRDGCAQPAMFGDVATGSFRPASGNALLVGDAAGLNIPVTGEGLAMSLKSGLAAARAVIEAKESRGEAEAIYLKAVDEVRGRFRELDACSRRVAEAMARQDPEDYAQALIESWDRALHLF
jgi:flavin-dependent dehydrogenase